jgi:glyoxylase-like metal-dependent hydrolase (beta-lactamase superfamily II)
VRELHRGLRSDSSTRRIGCSTDRHQEDELKRIQRLRAGCMATLVLSGAFVFAGCAGRQADAAPEGAGSVSLTWLSVTSWLLEAGDTRILFDGYVSRVDRTAVNDDGSSTATAPLDTAAVRRVRDAVPGARELDWVLVGHGHWDHAFDAPAWTRPSRAARRFSSDPA